MYRKSNRRIILLDYGNNILWPLDDKSRIKGNCLIQVLLQGPSDAVTHWFALKYCYRNAVLKINMNLRAILLLLWSSGKGEAIAMSHLSFKNQLPCPDSVYSHWIFFFFSIAYCLMRYTILPFRYCDTGLSDTKKISSMSFSSIHTKTGWSAAKTASACKKCTVTP